MRASYELKCNYISMTSRDKIYMKSKYLGVGVRVRGRLRVGVRGMRN